MTKKKKRRMYAIWLSIKYPKELHAYLRLQKRVANGYCSTVWPKGTKGFLQFINCVGRIPKSLSKPSISRKDHLKGYTPGNVFWQEMRENSREAGIRNAAKHSKRMKLYHKKNRIKVELQYWNNLPIIIAGIKRSWTGQQRKERLMYLQTRPRNENGRFIKVVP